MNRRTPIVSLELPFGILLCLVVWAMAFSGCSSRARQTEKTTGEPPVQTAESERELHRIVGLSKECHSQTRVPDAELISTTEWSATLSSAYADWAPSESKKLSDAFSRLVSCAQERDLTDELSMTTARDARIFGVSIPLEGKARIAQLHTRVRQVGHALRCMEFLREGLLGRPLSESCMRLLDVFGDDLPPSNYTSVGTAAGLVCKEERGSLPENHSAPVRIPGLEGEGGASKEAPSVCREDSFFDGLPVVLKSSEARVGIELLRRIMTMYQQFDRLELADVYMGHADALERQLQGRLETSYIHIPLDVGTLADRPGLPGIPGGTSGGGGIVQSGYVSILSFLPDKSVLSAWPSIVVELESETLSQGGPKGLRFGDGAMLRDAPSRSVSPTRRSPVELMSVRESLSSRIEHARSLEASDGRALVLAHRLGLWGAFRPALCASLDVGIARWGIVGQRVGGAEVTTVPLVMENKTPTGIEIAHLEVREDGFLASLPDGTRKVFPFVEGNPYLKLYRWLEEHHSGAVLIKPTARVEVQIITLLAEALAWERMVPSSVTRDLEFFKTPRDGSDTERRVLYLQTRCSSGV